jgi:cobalt-zinc-cadmium efflux system protein
VSGATSNDCAGHGHSHGHGAAAVRTRRLGVVLGLTAVYMVAEAVGGLLTNSLALLSDAGHMLTDVAAIALSMAAIWFGSRPAPAAKTFGYHRIEILAAFANGVTLVAIALIIIYEAYERLMAPPAVEIGSMMAVAAGGLAVNLVSAWLLSGRHDHGPRTLNEHGAFLHVVGDALGSVGALAAGGLMWWKGWYAADPAISIVIALLIIYSSYQLIREAVNVLLEATPAHINIAAVREVMLAMDGVAEVHDLHVWSITSGKDALSAHVVCGCDDYSKEMVERIRHRLQARFGISHITIQLETPDFEEDEIHF